MKKMLAMLVVALLMITPVNAQVRLGLKGGMNLSKMSFDKNIVSSDNQIDSAKGLES